MLEFQGTGMTGYVTSMDIFYDGHFVAKAEVDCQQRLDQRAIFHGFVTVDKMGDKE